jgi:lipopolysaccharide/colanic/teichoic acid biosynthesis glycosyltransferase
VGVSGAVTATKRCMDVIGALVGLALMAPLLPLIALGIYLQSPGPVLLRQRRAGPLLPPLPGQRLRFASFEMLKFRTMRLDAEKLSGPVLAAANDPRVFPLGRLLRRSRLDELPQLVNVLRGEMSLVGPRPERSELIGPMAAAIPLFEERMRGMKPGLTGLAQISLGYTGHIVRRNPLGPLARSWANPFGVPEAEGALADDLRLKLLYDVSYGAAIERFWTFLRWDLSILVRTPLAMLRGLGR